MFEESYNIQWRRKMFYGRGAENCLVPRCVLEVWPLSADSTSQFYKSMLLLLTFNCNHLFLLPFLIVKQFCAFTEVLDDSHELAS